MREVKEVEELYECLASVSIKGPIPNDVIDKYGYIVEVQVLVKSLLKKFDALIAKGRLLKDNTFLEDFKKELSENFKMADRSYDFLSRAGDHTGAHFAFVIKNVYQFILEEPGSKWTRFPTLRKS